MLRRFLLLCTLTSLTFSSATVLAKAKKTKHIVAAPVQTSLVVDSKTGKVLHAKNEKIRIHPASLTKLMTVYLAFEALESGKLSMNKKLYVSNKAEKIPPLKLGLKEGETITVRDAINGIIVHSANDASIVVAEGLAGSEDKFAKLMTVRAHQLGMKDTYFANSSGWHHHLQKTTATDLAKLSIALKRDYPQYYPLFSKHSFAFRGKVWKGHNRVAATYAGAEGLKTGFTCPSGFNLVTAASRGNKSLVAVVTGGRTWASRDSQMVQLLDTHFGVVTSVKAKAPKSKKRPKNIRVVSN